MDSADEEEGTGEDDQLDSDEALATDFNEDEFEKANAESDNSEETDAEVDELSGEASTTDVSTDVVPSLNRKVELVDVEARLKLKIRSIEFPENPAMAIRLLSEFSGVPFEFDLSCFNLLRTSIGSKLELKLDDVDVGTALDALAELLKWEVKRETGKLVVEPRDLKDDVPIEESFDISDLLDDANEAPYKIADVDEASYGDSSDRISTELITEMISSLIAPDEWGEGETQGKLSLDGKTLKVAHRASIRKEVELFLERLRALRGLEQKTDAPAESLIPEAMGWERLKKKTPLNYVEPAPLQQTLEVLERSQGIRLIWDDAALNESGMGRDSTVAAHFDSASLEQILTDLLESLKISYLILDDNLFMVTTREKADSYWTTEAHLFDSSDEVKAKDDVYSIVSELKSAVAPQSWNKTNSAIWCEPVSGCLIIRQCQPIQRDVRRWIDNYKKDATNDVENAPTNEKEENEEEMESSRNVETSEN